MSLLLLSSRSKRSTISHPSGGGDTDQKPEPRPTAHSQTLLACNTFQFTYLEQRASVDTGTCGTKTGKRSEASNSSTAPVNLQPPMQQVKHHSLITARNDPVSLRQKDTDNNSHPLAVLVFSPSAATKTAPVRWKFSQCTPKNSFSTLNNRLGSH